MCFDSYNAEREEIGCYSVISCEARNLQSFTPTLCNILSPELALPVRPAAAASRSHTALHMLGESTSTNHCLLRGFLPSVKPGSGPGPPLLDLQWSPVCFEKA